MLKKRLSIFQIVLIVLTVLFIFSNSMKTSETSANSSEKVTEIIKPPVETIVGEGKVTDHLVRKLAHFTEFALLGVQLALYFKKLSLFPLFSSLLIAVTDETIQIFYDRGSQVADIWIDYAGALFGFFVVLGIFVLIKAIAKSKKKL